MAVVILSCTWTLHAASPAALPTCYSVRLCVSWNLQVFENARVLRVDNGLGVMLELPQEGSDSCKVQGWWLPMEGYCWMTLAVTKGLIVQLSAFSCPIASCSHYTLKLGLGPSNTPFLVPHISAQCL
eukprot:1159711-Pelagomonas_calceolata.AAC.12